MGGEEKASGTILDSGECESCSKSTTTDGDSKEKKLRLLGGLETT